VGDSVHLSFTSVIGMTPRTPDTSQAQFVRLCRMLGGWLLIRHEEIGLIGAMRD